MTALSRVLVLSGVLPAASAGPRENSRTLNQVEWTGVAAQADRGRLLCSSTLATQMRHGSAWPRTCSLALKVEARPICARASTRGQEKKRRQMVITVCYSWTVNQIFSISRVARSRVVEVVG